MTPTPKNLFWRSATVKTNKQLKFVFYSFIEQFVTPLLHMDSQQIEKFERYKNADEQIKVQDV